MIIGGLRRTTSYSKLLFIHVHVSLSY